MQSPRSKLDRAIPRVCAALTAAAAVLLTTSIRAQDRTIGKRLFDATRVHTIDLRFARNDWYAQLTSNYASKRLLEADLTLDGSSFRRVGVRFRGNSSYKAIGNSTKKPFKIVLDAFVPGQEFDGVSTLNLNNSFRDPTFTREILAYELLGQWMLAPRACYATLRVNGQAWGPYISVEQINKDLLRRSFANEDGKRYRAELGPGMTRRDRSALVWLGNNPALYASGYELKSDNVARPFEDVRDLCNVLNNSAAQLPSRLPQILDVDQALRYLAGQVVLPAIDSYIGNVANNYLYREPDDGLFTLLPWDLNASFGGNAWLTVAQKIQLSPFYFANRTDRPLLQKVFAHAPWRDRYLAYVRDMLVEYDWTRVGARLAALQKLIEAPLRSDTRKLYSMQLFRDNVTRDVSILVNRRRQTIPGVQKMVTQHRAWLAARSDIARPTPQLGSLVHTPARATIASPVTVRVQSTRGARVTLHSRLARGPWTEIPMRDDGRSGDGQAGDGVFGASIGPFAARARVSYFVSASLQSAAVAIEPRLGGQKPRHFTPDWPRRQSTLRINEVLTKNTNGIVDERKEREDWFEITHSGPSAIDLGGLFVTDDPSKPKKWRIPAGVQATRDRPALFYADDETSEGPTHASFKLASSGESLWLFDRDGVHALDEIAWTAQRADLSLARARDGQDGWLTWLDPSPGRSNGGSCAYRRFRAPTPGAPGLEFKGVGTPRVGGRIEWQIGRVAPNTSALLFISASPALIPVAGTSGRKIFAQLPWIFADAIPVDALGGQRLRFPIPRDNAWIGVRIYASVLGLDAGRTISDSAGLETVICR